MTNIEEAYAAARLALIKLRAALLEAQEHEPAPLALPLVGYAHLWEIEHAKDHGKGVVFKVYPARLDDEMVPIYAELPRLGERP